MTLTSFFNGIGKTRITLEINAIAFFVLLALSPILTQVYGVQGLILTSIIASTFAAIFGAYLGKYKFALDFDSASLVKTYVVSLVSCLPLLFILYLTSWSSVLIPVAGATLYLTIYLTLVPMVRIIQKDELEKVERITQRIRLFQLIAKPVISYERRLIEIFQKQR